jgi:ubiquinol-cytochrome c reductase cytochrome c1 subunit
MLRKAFAIAAAAAGVVAAAVPALAATTQAPLKHIQWSFQGPFGEYDQEQLQRGFKVYREVCASCHSLNMIAFRNLGDPGAPFWNPKYPNPNDNPVVKAVAANYKISDIDPDTGDPTKRAATTADYFPAPFANEPAARATNGGALPPDMSLLAAAREGGPDYIYSIVGLGFTNPQGPTGLTLPPGKYYDPYFPGDLSSSWHGDPNAVPVGGSIGMPPPLTANRVSYDDGTPATVEQEAQDVSAFLNWASDPKMEDRKKTGMAVMVYLALFSGLLYASYRRVWRNVAH